MKYSEWVLRKGHIDVDASPIAGNITAPLFDFQRDVLAFLCQQGRAAAFLDTGLGKTLLQLEWARLVHEQTGGAVLVLAPLAVARQTLREAERFNVGPCFITSEQAEVVPGINITNYDKLKNFDPETFSGVVLDESSILKSFTGQTTRKLIHGFASTPYRLACTATPAPNDHTELGTHSEFLGYLTREEMLPRWFLHDSMNTKDWRLKGHAVKAFWSWVASWSRMVVAPSDLGYSDDDHKLPPLDIQHHTVRSDLTHGAEGQLFRMPDTSATSIHREKRLSLDDRCDVVADLVADGEQWLVWCDTDYEADAIMARVSDAVEVRGSHSAKQKEDALLGFADGNVRVLVTKPRIAGFGMNWQQCNRMAFAGLSFSYEAFYQAVRRCWRFGQTRPVQVHVVQSETEEAIWRTVSRKMGDHDAMKREMRDAMRRAQMSQRRKDPYNPTKHMRIPEWLTAA